MNARSMFLSGLFLVALPLSQSAGSAPTADAELVERYRRAMTLMSEEQFPDAQDILKDIVVQYGDSARATIGPAFGNVLYHLGVCYRQNEYLSLAADAFEAAYTDYPNTESAFDSRNAFHRDALVSWAEVEQLQLRYQPAIELYARAVKTERRPEPRARLLLNLGICLRETGKVDRAAELLRRVVREPQASFFLRRRSFLEVSRILVEHHGLEDVREWMNAYPDLMACSAADRYAYHDLVLQIGQRCVYMGGPRLALRWYAMLADPEDVRAELRMQAAAAIGPARPAATGPYDAFLENEATHTRRAEDLRVARAHAYYQLGLHRLAYPLYQTLAEHPGTRMRAEVLHAAAVCAALLDRPDDSGRYVDRLLTEDPGYPRRLEVATAHAQTLLRADRNAEALSVAVRHREAAPAGRSDREALDFVVASARFRLEEYPDAQREFALFHSVYPASAMAADASYYEARSALQMRHWREAADLLASCQSDRAAEKHLDGILYYRGMAILMLDDVEASQPLLEQVVRQHPDSPHVASALNLLGDIAFRESQWDLAEEWYQQAARRASEEGQIDVAALAEFQCIRIARIRQDWNTAIERYDELTRTAPTSPYRARAAVEIAFVHETLGQTDEAISLLLEQINAGERRAEDPELGDLLRAYAGVYRRAYGYEALSEHLAGFPAPHPLPRPLAAWLFLTRIQTLEDFGTSAHENEINDLYHSLATQFQAEELDDVFLLKLARWLHRRGEIEAAVSYYTVLAGVRWGSPHGDPARIELARILAADSTNPDGAARALAHLEEVETNSENPEWIEAAVLESARIHMQVENWTLAEERWSQYLSHEEWMTSRGEASYQLAACKDQLQQDEDAFAQYVSTYVNHEGQIEWSSRAFVRSALIQREQGNPDRAIEILGDMMDRLGNISHPVVNKARTLYQQWKSEAGKDQQAKRS